MRLYHKLLVLLLHCGQDLLDDLIGDVLDVSATFVSADGVDERDLLKSSFAQAANDLPAISLSLNDLR